MSVSSVTFMMKGKSMQRYYDPRATIDSVHVGDVVKTKWTGEFDTDVPWMVATVVDKGVDDTYAGGGWLRLDIDGKRTIKLSVQWAVKDD